MAFLRNLRKLVLGETWVLPIGVALALAVAGTCDALAGDQEWWKRGGGFVLLGLVVAVLLVSVGRPRR